ncbi:MAG: response regulator, partial [Nitrososphaerales archaeon]
MLVVEDHPDALDILTNLLEVLGFTVIGAKHGVEGVEKALKEKPQLILMDILMPLMDGREATRKIRSNPETHNIPILATTALYKEPEIKSCIDAGCNGCLVKPFSLKQLQGKIQEF